MILEHKLIINGQENGKDQKSMYLDKKGRAVAPEKVEFKLKRK